MKDDNFYSNLPVVQTSINDLLDDQEYFHQIPGSWHVVIADVKNSTKAIENGLHKIINLTATGSIIAALNIAKKSDIDIPFFFGGDGATLLIPDILLSSVMSALTEHKDNTIRQFKLELRLGNVPTVTSPGGWLQTQNCKD